MYIMENYNKENLLVKVNSSYLYDYKDDIDKNGQIGFVDTSYSEIYKGNVNYIYAQEQNFGDGAISSKTVLNSAIMFDGGPLATPEVINKLDKKYGKTNNVINIPSGTNLHELLSCLFSSILFPKYTVNYYTASFDIESPNIVVKDENNNIITNNSLVEYNSTLLLDTIYAPENYIFNGGKRYVSNMIYGFGYYNESLNVYPTVKDKYSYEVSWTNKTAKEISYFVNVELKTGGFNIDNISKNDYISETNFNIKIGENKLSLYNTANTYSSNIIRASVDKIPDIKLLANDGNYHDIDDNDNIGLIPEKPSEYIYGYNNSETEIRSITTSFNVTGVYRCFSNTNDMSFCNDSEPNTKCELTTGTVFEIEYNQENTESNYAMFKYPADRLIISVKVFNDLKNDYEDYKGGWNVYKTDNYNGIEYNIWERSVLEGDKGYDSKMKFKFTLDKKLDI